MVNGWRSILWDKMGDRMIAMIDTMKLDIDDLPWVDGRLNLYEILKCWKEHGNNRTG